MTDFFKGIDKVTFEGTTTSKELAFRHYDPEEIVMGKRMEDHLRFAVAYWHSFAWPGGDPFGGQTFERPWFGDTLKLAEMKADVAFDLFRILGQPFFCFHDADIRPDYQASIIIRRFEMRADGQVRLDASYSVKGRSGTERSATARSRSVTVRDAQPGNYESVVDSMSRALAELSKSIARDLLALKRKDG